MRNEHSTTTLYRNFGNPTTTTLVHFYLKKKKSRDEKEIKIVKSLSINKSMLKHGER